MPGFTTEHQTGYSGAPCQRSPGGSARTVLAVLVGASLMAVAGRATAQNKKEGVQFEIGVAGGAHLFNENLELGVADDPTLTSPENAPLFGLRLGLRAASDVRDRGRRRRHPDQGARHRRERVHHRARAATSSTTSCPARSRAAGSSRSCSRAPACLNVASTDGDGSYTAIKKDTDFAFHGGVGREVLPDRHRPRSGWTRARIGVPNTESKSYSLDWEFMAGIGFTLRRHGAVVAPPPPPLIKDSDNDGIPDDARQVSDAGRAEGQRRLPRQGHRRRRRRRPQGQVPRQGRPGRARRLPRRGQGQRRHRRREGQVPRRARGQGQVRGRGRLPRSGQRQGRRRSTRTTSVPPRPRPRTAIRTTTAARTRSRWRSRSSRASSRGSTSGATRPTSRRRPSRC